jgi:hypothetical protein
MRLFSSKVQTGSSNRIGLQEKLAGAKRPLIVFSQESLDSLMYFSPAIFFVNQVRFIPRCILHQRVSTPPPPVNTQGVDDVQE